MVSASEGIAQAPFPSITVSFCTRNRRDDLMRAVRSVIAQAPGEGHIEVTILVVDDGDLDGVDIEALESETVAAGWKFDYFNKKVRGGLFRSRIESLARARSEVVIFFDDDVVVEPGYLLQVAKTFRDDPRLSGLGGVDLLCPVAPLWRRIYEYLILYRSMRPGMLSLTGYGGSMDRWIFQASVFEVDYLYGCNMAFRRRALAGMTDPGIFEGHATAEDLYLARIALCSGRVVVDPALKVRHYQSPLARDRMDQVFYRQVVNHYRILETAGAGILRRTLVLYTAAGLVLLVAVRCAVDAIRGRPLDQWPRLRGGWRGALFVLRRLFSGTTGRRGSPLA